MKQMTCKCWSLSSAEFCFLSIRDYLLSFNEDCKTQLGIYRSFPLVLLFLLSFFLYGIVVVIMFDSPQMGHLQENYNMCLSEVPPS